jgi:hypothetical protein
MRLPVVLLIAAAIVPPMSGASVVAAADSGCQQKFDSTFDLIQKVVFEGRGCTSAACHSGAAPTGGLDLSAGASYDNLVDRPPQSVSVESFPGLARVVPGNKGRSLLWLNLAAATLPDQWKAPLRPMPQGGLPPLSLDELDLVGKWIEIGASRDGVVPGTGDLFNACLPPPEPIKVKPLDPPPAGTGTQIRAPQQVLAPHSEREVCFVSYYDVTDQVPAEFRGPGGDTFRYKRLDARQDPLSHHAVVNVYNGRASIDDPVWGPFTCASGSRAGQSCQPTNPTSCNGDGVCASPPVPAVACIGYGPGDASIGVGERSLYSTMGTTIDGSDGIYQEAPLRGILVWNSHAFDVTDESATLDMWMNFYFAAPDEQLHLLERFTDVSAIFKMLVPPFAVEEVCNRYVMPAGAKVVELTSHTHKRGKRFRIFRGDFSCQGGPNTGQACSPFGPDPGLPVPDLCAGAPCQSRQPPRVGDCNGDGAVSVDELVLGVKLALDGAAPSACPAFDGDGNGAISVDELIGAVEAALHPLRDPNASLVYTSLTYGDPVVRAFAPPQALGSTAADRTFTYCALYDNGFTNPAEVKRRSQTPTNGTPCHPTHCAEGTVGEPCSTDADCETASGAHDGSCDACSVGFGVTTDDEMFVLAGSFIRN